MILKNVIRSGKYFPLLIFLFSSINIFAQIELSQWLFSGPATNGLPFRFDFSSLPPTLLTESRKMNFNATNSSVCDKNGNLLFYTNGIWIANSTGDTMLNGGRINPGNFPSYWITLGLPEIQGTLILQFPGDSSKYYIFHNAPSLVSPNYYYPLVQYYSTIDMTQDSGKGEVMSKNNLILIDTIHSGELTACKHANGRDWWILIHQFRSDLFYRLLITPQGISVDGIQSIGTFRNKSSGQACFSPNGKWYAQYSGDTEMNLYNFDRCSGLLSNYLHTQFPDSAPLGGIAFSASSKFLYATTPNTVYQFNMNDTDIVSSKQTVALWDTTYSPSPPFAAGFYLMELMRDEKIYIVCNNSTKTFHRINYPDSLGVACNVEQHFIQLPAYNAFTIPNFPNYYLGADSGSVCDTLQLGIKNSQIENKNQMAFVFPNPASDRISLNYDKEFTSDCIFSIFDLLGNQVKSIKLSKDNNQVSLDISDLNPALFFYVLSQNGKVIQKNKIAIIK